MAAAVAAAMLLPAWTDQSRSIDWFYAVLNEVHEYILEHIDVEEHFPVGRAGVGKNVQTVNRTWAFKPHCPETRLRQMPKRQGPNRSER